MRDETPDLESEDGAVDLAGAQADALAGDKAARELLRHAGRDGTRWFITLRGLRGLRSIAFAKSGTNDMKAYAFRQEMGDLLQQRKYANINLVMTKQIRSASYKLLDRLEEIEAWYATLPSTDKLRWASPESFVKWCPKEYLRSASGNQRKASKGKKKPAASPEIERLRALLTKVIKRLAKHEPDALELLDQVTPEDPDDSLDDI